MALAERQAGLLDDAARSLSQAVEDSLAVDARMVVLGCLELGALLAMDRERSREAASLLGASARLREELETAVDDFEDDLLERAERDARASSVMTTSAGRSSTDAHSSSRTLLPSCST